MYSIFNELFWVHLFVLIPVVLFVFSSEMCYGLQAVEIIEAQALVVWKMS